MIEVDDSELRALAATLDNVGKVLPGQVRGVVEHAAVNVKKAMRQDMAESRHFRQVARAITYDLHSTTAVSEAEIGPETQGATVGDLAHFAYFGGAQGGGGTVRDPQEAANDEAPKFEKALTALVTDLL